jgi:hypothetical protein
MISDTVGFLGMDLYPNARHMGHDYVKVGGC